MILDWTLTPDEYIGIFEIIPSHVFFVQTSVVYVRLPIAVCGTVALVNVGGGGGG